MKFEHHEQLVWESSYDGVHQLEYTVGKIKIRLLKSHWCSDKKIQKCHVCK